MANNELQVGLQLFSVRNHMAEDWRATLRSVAEAGYRYIEPANHHMPEETGIGFGVPAADMKNILDETGLAVCNTHLSPVYDERILPALPAVLEYQHVIGCSRVTAAIGFFADLDAVLRAAELFDKAGAICRAEGVTFMYHNHYQEFQPFYTDPKADPDKMVMDYLMENTDPANVSLELDTYWVARGGEDIQEILRRYGSRIRMIHQKDFTAGYPGPVSLRPRLIERGIPATMEYYNDTKEPEAFTEIGTGILDIQGIVDTAREVTEADYIILEQDFSRYDELESIRISMDGFKKIHGVKW